MVASYATIAATLHHVIGPFAIVPYDTYYRLWHHGHSSINEGSLVEVIYGHGVADHLTMFFTLKNLQVGSEIIDQ